MRAADRGRLPLNGYKATAEDEEPRELESARWRKSVETAAEKLTFNGVDRSVHVMDREADAYSLLAILLKRARRFIVRSRFDRQVELGQSVSEAVASKPIVVTREVPLSYRRLARFPAARKIHPPRAGRMATLGIKATQVSLLRPRTFKKEPPGIPQTAKMLTLNVVVVEEVDPPEGQPPVSWRLYTTEPIETAAQLERIVDGYRCRWRIEEFFKALKTGCAIEKRQLESLHSLLNALAVYVPIAWQVLRHRTLAHNKGDRPATEVLNELQLLLLQRAGKRKVSSSATIAEALVAVAGLGGHLKRNGEPGWITLARGYERLLTLEEGARLARQM